MTVNVGAIGLSALEGAGLVALQSIVGKGPLRGIFWQASDTQGPSALLPTVVVEERHLDEVVITDHPVELGAAISDHAYKRPSELAIRAGWSESAQSASFSPAALVSSLIPTLGDPTYLTRLYQKLLQLQTTRQLVGITTGKRSYDNMLLRALQVMTDEKTEYCLSVNAVFREVIIVKTQTVTLSAAALHKSPQSTAATTNRGTIQPQPADAAAGARA